MLYVVAAYVLASTSKQAEQQQAQSMYVKIVSISRVTNDVSALYTHNICPTYMYANNNIWNMEHYISGV